jgi:hypothetical protein
MENTARTEDKLLTHGMTWMDLKDIMVSERPVSRNCMLYDSVYITLLK